MLRFIIVFFLVSFPIIAQETVLQMENVKYSNFIKDKKAFALSDSETNELAVIVPDKNTVTGYLLNENFKKTSEITGESLRIKFKELIGYRVENGKYTTVFTTKNYQFYGIIEFDFTSGKTVTKQLDLNIRKEKVLEAVSYKNRFFLLTLDDKFDGLILRELKADGTFKKNEIAFDSPVPFKDLVTLNNKPDKVGESRALNSFSTIYPPKVVEIDNVNPNSIETTSELNKVYTRDNNLIFTFDNFVDFTLTYSLDLSTFKTTERRFPKETVSDMGLKKSNSFLYGSHLFQFGVDNDHMVFSVSDFNSGEKIKTYKAGRDEEIDFKNSEIFQKNGFLVREGKVRELEKTSQYLRKVGAGNPGIAIQKNNNIYQVTLGSTQLTYDDNVTKPRFGLAPTATLSGVIMTPYLYNPTYLSYENYSLSKSIYIHSLFDSDFHHLEGNPSENVFDKIKTFQDSLTKTHAEEVFSHNGKVYFGYYYDKTENYNIVFFDN